MDILVGSDQMIKESCIPLDSPANWKEALKGIKHAFAHSWENCYAMYLTTGHQTYLYCYETENVRIICPIAERKFDKYIDIVTPYGFSGFVGNGDCSEFPYYWKKFVREKAYVCGYIALNPSFENNTHLDLNETYQSNSLYVLDLTLSYDEIFANLDRNRKRQLKNWEEISSHLILDKSILTDFLLTHYPEFIRRVNASQACHFSQETLSLLCSLDNVLMVGAGKPEKLEAVYVFAYTPHVADCLFNVALPEGRQYATVLLWYGLNYLKSIQIPLLNLGGGVRENDSVAQSKQRFGCTRLPFRCLKQVYEQKIYNELCQRVNADPNNMTGYFPLYRKP